MNGTGFCAPRLSVRPTEDVSRNDNRIRDEIDPSAAGVRQTEIA